MLQTLLMITLNSIYPDLDNYRPLTSADLFRKWSTIAWTSALWKSFLSSVTFDKRNSDEECPTENRLIGNELGHQVSTRCHYWTGSLDPAYPNIDSVVYFIHPALHRFGLFIVVLAERQETEFTWYSLDTDTCRIDFWCTIQMKSILRLRSEKWG